MQDLAIQVRPLDDVVVDDADGADARPEAQQRRAAEAAGADDQHARARRGAHVKYSSSEK